MYETNSYRSQKAQNSKLFGIYFVPSNARTSFLFKVDIRSKNTITAMSKLGNPSTNEDRGNRFHYSGKAYEKIRLPTKCSFQLEHLSRQKESTLNRRKEQKLYRNYLKHKYQDDNARSCRNPEAIHSSTPQNHIGYICSSLSSSYSNNSFPPKRKELQNINKYRQIPLLDIFTSEEFDVTRRKIAVQSQQLMPYQKGSLKKAVSNFYQNCSVQKSPLSQEQDPRIETENSEFRIHGGRNER